MRDADVKAEAIYRKSKFERTAPEFGRRLIKAAALVAMAGVIFLPTVPEAAVSHLQSFCSMNVGRFGRVMGDNLDNINLKNFVYEMDLNYDYTKVFDEGRWDASKDDPWQHPVSLKVFIPLKDPRPPEGSVAILKFNNEEIGRWDVLQFDASGYQQLVLGSLPNLMDGGSLDLIIADSDGNIVKKVEDDLSYLRGKFEDYKKAREIFLADFQTEKRHCGQGLII